VLTQAREELIRRTVDSCIGAKRAIVHVYNSVAPVFRRVVFGMGQDEIVQIAVNGTRLIKELVAAHIRNAVGPGVFAGILLDHRAGIQQAHRRRRQRSLAADAAEQTDRQPALDRRGQHPERLRRPDRMDVAQPGAPRQPGHQRPPA
jgi:isopropylmalate/homocitrate/citramalate synthase